MVSFATRRAGLFMHRLVGPSLEVGVRGGASASSVATASRPHGVLPIHLPKRRAGTPRRMPRPSPCLLLDLDHVRRVAFGRERAYAIGVGQSEGATQKEEKKSAAPREI
jgi:hypothetical protein